MSFNSCLTPKDVLDVFAREVLALQGRVSDTFDDGSRVFARSILPKVEEVRAGDGFQGGVALKATESEVWLYPYIFRLVCRNGAIITQTVGSWSLADLDILNPDMATQSIQEGIEVCTATEVFADTILKMRTSSDSRVDIALNMMPFVSRLAELGNSSLLTQIMDQFFLEGDQTRFGLANAVTAVARETRDPQLRWELEVLGGAIAVGSAVRSNRPAPVG